MSVTDTRTTSWRSAIYDYIIVKMTTQWYKQALSRMPTGSRVLDVGIGTATSLLANKDLMLAKQLKFVGVDYDAQYVAFAEENFKKLVSSSSAAAEVPSSDNSTSAVVAKNSIDASYLSLTCCSIHDYNTSLAEKFDVIYFSGSFMIIPDQVKALKHCAKMLNASAPTTSSTSTSPIIFTQTFENRGLVGKIVAFFKPFFKYALTIDFGNATFEEDFVSVCEEAEVTIDAIVPMRTTPFRREVLVLATPKGYGANQ